MYIHTYICTYIPVCIFMYVNGGILRYVCKMDEVDMEEVHT